MKAFEPIYDEFTAGCLEDIASTQTSVTTHIHTDGKEDIKNILQAIPTASISGGELLSGEANYNGIIQYKIMYEGISGNVGSVSYQTEFSGKVVSDKIQPTLKPLFSVKLVETKVDSFAANEITVTSVFEVSLKAVVLQPVKVLTDASPDVELLCSELRFSRVSSSASGTFMVSGESEVKDALSGVLSSYASVLATSSSAGLDCVVAGGDVYVTVTYKTDAESMNIKCLSMEIPFKQEVTSAGAMAGQSAFANASVKSVRVTAEVDEESGKTKITVEAELEINVCSYEDGTFNAAEDAVSPLYNFNIDYSEICSCFDEGTLNFSDMISTGFEIEEGAEIDKIIGISASPLAIASCFFSEDKVTVEGVAASTVLYMSNDEIKSMEIESPFSISQPYSGDAAGCVLSAEAAVVKCTAKHKRTKQIDLQLEIETVVHCMRYEKQKLITEISVAGDKAAPDCAIEVYFPRKGEKLWDIAKTLGTMPKTLTQQNPELEFPADEGDRIILYHKK